MNARKLALVAVLSALAAPLAAAAATPERTHSPLSHWAALATDSGDAKDARPADAVCYPLASYAVQQKSANRVAQAKAAAEKSASSDAR